MSWWNAVPVVLTCLGLVVVPGAVLAYALGFRRVSLLGLAPVLSLSIVGVAAVVAPWLHVGWSIVPVVVLCLLASVVAWLATKPRRAAEGDATLHRDSWWVLGGGVIGVAAGAFLVGRRIMQLVGAPDNISQRYDNVFQLNAIRYIVDSGNGSTLTLGQMAGGKGLSAVYPAVWHDLASLLVQLTGTEVPLAENAVNLTIGAFIWPISIIFLTRVVVGPKPMALIAAGIVSAGLPAFPYLLLVWGPLFPNMLSVSVIPAALAVVILLCKLSDQRERPLRLWLALVLVVPGMALSHMSAIGAMLAFGAPIVLWTVALHVLALIRSKAPLRKYAIVLASAALGIVVAVLAWKKLRPGNYSGWIPHTDMPGAIGEVISNAPMDTRVAWIISILAVIGAATIIGRRKQIWWLASYFVAAGLYIIDAAIDRGALRTFATGIWYADTNRLAAYLPIFAVVLAAIGFTKVAEGALAMPSRLKAWFIANRAPEAPTETVLTSTTNNRWARPAGMAVVVVMLGILAAGSQVGAIRTYIVKNQQFYDRGTSSSILSDDEYKLLSRIDGEVPATAVVAGNPWNGSALVYAFADRKVLRYHLSQARSVEEYRVEHYLKDAAGNPVVCKAIKDLNVRYVLDFGTQYLLNNPDAENYPGFLNLAESDSVKLIDQEGAAKLYKVTACW
ncbi:MAG: DUF6541 family protein [Specibacter sp.]